MASGPALPAGAAPWPGLGAEMWEGWFLLFGNVWVEARGGGQVRVDEDGEGDKGYGAGS